MHFFHHSRGGQGLEGQGQAIPLPKELSKEFRILDPKQVRFERDDGTLRVQIEGEEERKKVNLARLFPLGEPERWISVLDTEGHELGIMQDLEGLDTESRRLVLEELRRRYIVPQIQRILSCKEKFEMVEWEVQTDRGTTAFLTRNLRDNLQQPDEGRLILTDVDGNRYDIADVRALDMRSRNLLEQHV